MNKMASIDFVRAAGTEEPANQTLFIEASAQMHCGVGQFAQLLREAIEKLGPGRFRTLSLTRSEGTLAEIWHATSLARNVICNLPIVAWKRVIFRPLLALALARLRGRHVVLIQHEWASLHPLRRTTYIPALLLANTIVMFSPLVRRELAEDPLVGFAAKKAVLAPLPPNIKAPAVVADSELRRQLAAGREEGRLVVGQFGSIYPGKGPEGLLAICKVLKQLGKRPLIVYVGSFIRGGDNVEQDFFLRAAELGVSGDIIVSGYVASNDEVFGLFSEIDVFCYPLDEGLTARRASVLACIQSGRPVIAAAPAGPDEFAHHPRFGELIDRGAVVLVARGSADAVYADAIIATVKQPPVPMPLDFDAWWSDVAAAIRAQLG